MMEVLIYTGIHLFCIFVDTTMDEFVHLVLSRWERFWVSHALQWISAVEFDNINFVTDFKTMVDVFDTAQKNHIFS